MDSPRGRIVLMRVGNEEGSEASAEMRTHFDRCLGCMACVTACPSGVQYDKLILETRPQVERNAPRPRRERLVPPGDLRALHPSRAGCARWRPMLALQQRLGVRERLAPAARPRAGAARAAAAGAAGEARGRRSRRLPEVTPAHGTPRGRVAFMQGCIQRVFFGDVNAATVRVLSAEGWEVARAAAAALLRLAAAPRRRGGGGARRSPRRRSRPTRASRRSRSTSPAAARA